LSRAAAVTGRTAHADDVGAGVVHEAQVVGRQLAGQRDEQSSIAGGADPRVQPL